MSVFHVQVGGRLEPSAAFGLLPDSETLTFLSLACNGCVIQPDKVFHYCGQTTVYCYCLTRFFPSFKVSQLVKNTASNLALLTIKYTYKFFKTVISIIFVFHYTRKSLSFIWCLYKVCFLFRWLQPPRMLSQDLWMFSTRQFSSGPTSSRPTPNEWGAWSTSPGGRGKLRRRRNTFLRRSTDSLTRTPSTPRCSGGCQFSLDFPQEICLSLTPYSVIGCRVRDGFFLKSVTIREQGIVLYIGLNVLQCCFTKMLKR